MKHSFCNYTQFCRTCGRSFEDCVSQNIRYCDGHDDTLSFEYIKKAAAAKKLFGPVVDEILEKLEGK
jgi:hypothetical protein